MFQKLRDAANSLNTQKMKKDMDVMKKRFVYRMKENKRELSKTWDIGKFKKTWGAYMPNLQNYSQYKGSFQKLDNWYTNKRDKMSQNFDNSTKQKAKSVSNFGIRFIKSAPFVLFNGSK